MASSAVQYSRMVIIARSCSSKIQVCGIIADTQYGFLRTQRSKWGGRIGSRISEAHSSVAAVTTLNCTTVCASLTKFRKLSRPVTMIRRSDKRENFWKLPLKRESKYVSTVGHYFICLSRRRRDTRVTLTNENTRTPCSENVIPMISPTSELEWLN